MSRNNTRHCELGNENESETCISAFELALFCLKVKCAPKNSNVFSFQKETFTTYATSDKDRDKQKSMLLRN